MLDYIKKLVDLGEGSLVALPTDVANPKTDRRKKYDWRCFPLFREGSKFRLNLVTVEDNFLDPEEVSRFAQTWQAKGAPVVGGKTVLGIELTPVILPGYQRPSTSYSVRAHIADSEEPTHPTVRLAHMLARQLVGSEPEDLEELFRLKGVSASHILDLLIDSGKVNIAEVQEVLDGEDD